MRRNRSVYDSGLKEEENEVMAAAAYISWRKGRLASNGGRIPGKFWPLSTLKIGGRNDDQTPLGLC